MSTAALIIGEVTHERSRPALHRFTYPLLWLRVPLHELEFIRTQLALNRWALLAFWERDHGARDESSLLDWICSLLTAQGVAFDAETLEVDLMTSPRVLGYVFNPVSFWVCKRRAADGERQVFAVLAEVNNTFHESHRYLLTPPTGEQILSGQTIGAEKKLHVSPFNEVCGRYEFRFNFASDRWLAVVDYFDGADESSSINTNATCLLHTHINGKAKAITQTNLRHALLRFPLQSFAVVARIHWHALLLAIKRVPFHGKLVSKMTGISRS
jgi:uncharacterized protein